MSVVSNVIRSLDEHPEQWRETAYPLMHDSGVTCSRMSIWTPGNGEIKLGLIATLRLAWAVNRWRAWRVQKALAGNTQARSAWHSHALRDLREQTRSSWEDENPAAMLRRLAEERERQA